MPITFQRAGGVEIRPPRTITGFYSLDRAFGNRHGALGVPHTAMELFGPTHSGKSTLAYALLGSVGRMTDKSIALADIEGFDEENVVSCLSSVHFDGNVINIDDPNDEERLDLILKTLQRKDVVGSLLDSIAAISPVGELEGKAGEANWGRRAMLMSQHFRKLIHLIRSNPKLAIYTNHVHPNMGGYGTTTPGGETIKYLCATRVKIKAGETFPPKPKEDEDILGYVIEGTVVKNRFGYKMRSFQVVVLNGLGVHPGMSALYDCVKYGIVKRGKTLSVDGESLGYMKNYIQYGLDGNEKEFDRFFELLQHYNPKAEVSKEIDEDLDDDDNSSEE